MQRKFSVNNSPELKIIKNITAPTSKLGIASMLRTFILSYPGYFASTRSLRYDDVKIKEIIAGIHGMKDNKKLSIEIVAGE